MCDTGEWTMRIEKHGSKIEYSQSHRLEKTSSGWSNEALSPPKGQGMKHSARVGSWMEKSLHDGMMQPRDDGGEALVYFSASPRLLYQSHGMCPEGLRRRKPIIKRALMFAHR
ncbi:hypothetical protein LIA77_00103 [Sarocladium implicatum]|nr:hypothetical protein LIA77_00103 [Sarocladium implicatum]